MGVRWTVDAGKQKGRAIRAEGQLVGNYLVFVT
jgi:hypothetical protein